MNEKDLAIRFIEGGNKELEEVIDIYGEKLLRYATTILCDGYEAEDVVQECFIAAYKNKHNFDGKNLSAWLYKITYNLSLNKIKKRRILYFGNIFINDNSNTNSNDMDLSQDTLNALKKLKPKDRALIYGRIMENLSYKELSSQIDLSEEVLRKRYQRAKDKLAKELHNKKGV